MPLVPKTPEEKRRRRRTVILTLWAAIVATFAYIFFVAYQNHHLWLPLAILVFGYAAHYAADQRRKNNPMWPWPRNWGR